MTVRWQGFFYTDVEDKPTDVANLVEKPICKVPKLRIFLHVLYGIKTRPFFLPSGRMIARSFNLKVKEFTLALKKPGAEAPHSVTRQNDTG